MNKYISISRLTAVIGILFFLSNCGGVQPLKDVLRKQTPHEKYEQALKNVKLENTALGNDWIAAGRKALQDSVVVSLPFRETGYFAADKPLAVSYRVILKRGERLVIGVEVKSAQSTQIFIDLFEIQAKPSGAPRHLASADTTSNIIDYESREDHTYLVRLQPELLRSGNYTITMSREPTLAFPVQGKDSRNISSFWGANRDGGRRRHEGIDIFAKRGTPVIAATDGYISGVNENNLGGKVVWLQDTKRQQTLYYAHLDQQLVRPGQRVLAGDTIGLIGNTGNARTTDPHLHFGIYTFGRGAVDPLPSVRAGSPAPDKITASLERLGNWARVSAKNGVLHLSPDKQAAELTKLQKNMPLFILGGVKDWYRVALPDNQVGYVQAKLVENADKPIRTHKIVAATHILDQPTLSAAFLTIAEAGSQLPVLASFGTYLYVRTKEGIFGWLPVS
jgi:murein DD-endopeptidase MepM/ murein hydrolase activator NlpD